MADYDDTLANKFGAYTEPVHLASKHDIIQYYQDTYGTKNWKRELTIKLAGTSDSRTKEYKSAARNFQGSRLNEAGNTKKWKEVGKTLPPVSHKFSGKPPSQVIIKGVQHRGGYRGSTRNRTFIIPLSQSDAYSFIQGDITVKRLTRDFYGFDLTESTGGGEDADTSSGEVDIYSIDVD